MKRLLILLICSLPIHASATYCGGKVVGVYITPTGDVIIRGDWRNDWTRICNLKSDPAVDTLVCSLWASYAGSALQNNTSVLLTYADSQACLTLPTYTASPTPGYFMLTK